MTDLPPERQQPEPPSAESDFPPDDFDQPTVLPRWIPVLIAAVLVALAGLAIYTGARYRNDTLVRIVRPRRQPPASTPAPPGEPEPGASLVFPGDAGDTTPEANPAVSGRARAVITGTGGVINTTVRIWARRGMMIDAEPADALVYVNDVAVGQARQFSREPYEFAQPGSYTVRVDAPGYASKSFVVTAEDRAKSEVAKVAVRLQKS